MRFAWVLAVPVALGTWATAAWAQPEPASEPTEAEPPPAEATEEELPAEGEGALPPEPRPGPEPEEDEGPEQPLTPPAQDSLGGHITVSGSALWAIPFASLEADVDQSEVMSAGPGFGLELAYGMSRTVALGAWGQALLLDGSDDCSGCSTRSLAGGLFIRYHLVQGLRFDPWMSAGAGYRVTTIDPGSEGEDVTYSGIEWLRLSVGGDWYAFENFGFGPYLELDMGRYSSRSPDGLGDSANHWHFITGARVTFDTPGK